jgi:hypothetical protein
MKTLKLSKTLFILSLLAFIISSYLLVTFLDSGRYSSIAGALFSMALAINVGAYFSKEK